MKSGLADNTRWGMVSLKRLLRMKGGMAVFCSVLLLSGCAGNAGAPRVDVDISPIISSQNITAGNEGIVIGSVTMSSSEEWYKEVIAGMRAAAFDLGITLIEQDSNGDLTAEESQIRGFINDHVDAIVICPITSDRSGTVLSAAEDAGIPVVTWNNTVDADVTAAVCVDPIALGGNTGDYLAEYVRTNNLSGVQIGMITNESYVIGVERCDGFKQALETLGNDGSAMVVCEILAEAPDETDAAVRQMLSDYPGLDVIWCWNQTSLLACIDTVKNMGNTDLIIMGTDMSMDLARDMQEGDVNLLAVTTQLPFHIGYKAVVNAVRAAKGEEVEKNILIPTFTYIKNDTDDLAQYIDTHAQFVQ